MLNPNGAILACYMAGEDRTMEHRLKEYFYGNPKTPVFHHYPYTKDIIKSFEPLKPIGYGKYPTRARDYPGSALAFAKSNSPFPKYIGGPISIA